MYDIEIEKKMSIAIYDDVIIPSRHASNRQRPIFSDSYGLSQWNLTFRDIFRRLLMTLHQKGEKTRHRSSNDDVINLKAMTERYTFSSIL